MKLDRRSHPVSSPSTSGSKLLFRARLILVASTSTVADVTVTGSYEQPLSRRQHVSRRSDHHIAIVNRAARLVADQVRINVSDVERTTPFQHKPATDRMFVKGESGWHSDSGSHRRRVPPVSPLVACPPTHLRRFQNRSGHRRHRNRRPRSGLFGQEFLLRHEPVSGQALNHRGS